MNVFLQKAGHERQNFPPQNSALPERKRPLRVLVAEDDDDHRQNLNELLDLYGIAVLEAENGEAAVELTLQERPDLILLNAELPELDGFEAARVIRNIKSLDCVPIIFLCAETDRKFRKQAFAAGCDSFHIAPLDFERLDQILENFLFHEDYAVGTQAPSPAKVA